MQQSVVHRTELMHHRPTDNERSLVPITAMLDVHFAADHLVDGPAMFTEILKETRDFTGCLRVDLLADIADPAHYVAYELWESNEHDLAYRAWRQGEGATTLRDVLDRDPVLTKFETAVQS